MRNNTRYEQAMAFYDRAAHFSSIADHRKNDDVRKLRPDLTKEELERLKEYGSLDYVSAGATRKR